MKFPGPDGAVLAWHSAQEDASTPRGTSFGQSGRDYDSRCSNARCRRMGTRITTYHKGIPIPKCSTCGTPWQFENAMIPANVFASGSGVGVPWRVERAATLDLIIDRLFETPDLDLGQAAIYTGWLCKRTKSLEQVALDATAKRFAGRDWALRDVRRAVSRSRRWLEFELDGRGLLQKTERGSNGFA